MESLWKGTGIAYKKLASLRAIDADEYHHLEDPSGNSSHISGMFRREEWHERTWLNSHLVFAI